MKDIFKVSTENIRAIESEALRKLASDFCDFLKKSLTEFQSLFIVSASLSLIP